MPVNILQNIPAMLNSKPLPIVHAEELSEHDFNFHFVSKSMPCLIKGAVVTWPAFKRWKDPAYFAHSAEKKVRIFLHDNHLPSSKKSRTGETLGFGEALKILNDNNTIPAFLEGVDPEHSASFKTLLDDIGSFAFLKQLPKPILYPAARFIFHRNGGTAWHQHPFDETLMCQIVGSKRVGLVKSSLENHNDLARFFSREEYYDSSSAYWSSNISTFDLQWWSTEVHEGDALYIPPVWWHGVIPSSCGYGITIPIGWRSPLAIVGDLRSPCVRRAWRNICKGKFPFRRKTAVIFLVASFVMQSLKAFKP